MSITLEIYNNKVKIANPTPKSIRSVREVCTFEYEYYGMDFLERPPRPARKTATINYYDDEDHSFPAGWVSRVLKAFKLQGIPAQWVDKRIPPTKKINIQAEGLYPLREEYQVPAFDKALKSTRGIVAHATGGGKTILMFHLINKLKLKTLIIVPDRNLLYQTYQGATQDDEALIDFFGEENCGLIGDSRFEPSNITVATVQTLWNGFKNRDKEILSFLSSIDLLLIDESHHISIAGRNKIKNSYYQIVQYMPAYYRFGFTATPGAPGSLERSLLEAATGRIIHHVSSSQLIKWGYLTPPKIYFYEINCQQRYGDWHTAYKKNILLNKERNNKIKEVAQELNAQGKTVLIIVKRVEDHGVILNEMIPGSELMTGKTPAEEREELMTQFADKKLMTLISTVIREGTNIPSMDAVIIAAGGKSVKAITQWIGRPLRKSGGKESATIIDFMDKDGGMLQKHSRRRLKVYDKEEEFEVIMR